MNWAFLPYKRYADFSGRSRRKEYWSFKLFWYSLYCGYLFLAYVIDPEFEYGITYVVSIIYIIFALATIIPNLALFVRRLHDIGMSGWNIFISLVPVFGSIILFIFTLADSKPGPNQYGPNPKEESNPGLPVNY